MVNTGLFIWPYHLLFNYAMKKSIYFFHPKLIVSKYMYFVVKLVDLEIGKEIILF